MDIDFDLESDRIGQFLRNKLKEIQNKNKELEESLKCRQQRLTALQSTSQHSFQLDEPWKRIFQQNYIIGFPIGNIANMINNTNFNLILNWDNPINLLYRYRIISTRDDLKINSSQETIYIIIIINIPSFIEQLEYNVQGILEFQQDKYHLPVIKLSNQDLTSNTILIQIYKMSDGDLEDFLTVYANNKKYEFIIILPKNNNRNVEIIFETYCALRCVNLNTTNRFFVTHNISTIFDGCLVEINGNYQQKNHIHVSLYCWSQKSLEALLHYLHRKILNSSLIPYDIYNNSYHLIGDNLCDKLRDNVGSELTFLTDLSKQNNIGNNLSILELSTDLIAIKLIKN